MRRRLLAVFLAPFIISACGGSPAAPTPQCATTPANVNINIGFGGGPGVVTITSSATTCAWAAVSNSAALTITSGANGSGTGTIAFTVAENTSPQPRAHTITFTPAGGAAIQITVNQAAAPPPIVYNPPAPPAGTVGVAYSLNVATAQGGTGELRYQLDTLGGFPPIGLTLAPNGLISGVPTIAGVATFRVCAVDTTGRQSNPCPQITIVINATTTGGGGTTAANGTWSGTIVLQVGCTAPLPSNYPWTGTIRSTSSGGTELVVTVPRAFVFNEVHPLTITGQNVRFTVDFDSLYTFTGTFSADFRTITGTFAGGNCNLASNPVFPSGTWNGTKQ